MSEPAAAVTGPHDEGRLRRRVTRRSVVVGVVTAVVVVAIGVVLLVFQPHSWKATTSLVVLPDSARVDASTAASYYDTLSQGQVSTTFAQILQSQGGSARLAGDTGLSRAQLENVTITVNPVPDTSIIDVDASAPTAGQAALAANRVADSGRQTLQSLGTPYATSIVDRAAPEVAEPAGPSAVTLVAVIAVVAVVAAVGAQQMSWLVGVAVQRRGAPRPSPARSASHVPRQPANQAWPDASPETTWPPAGDVRAAARPPQPGTGPAARQLE
ncbi:MAG: Wzz/FepE/Etk N-terminal domain-containing protein [Sciscionella sp.]